MQIMYGMQIIMYGWPLAPGWKSQGSENRSGKNSRKYQVSEKSGCYPRFFLRGSCVARLILL